MHSLVWKVEEDGARVGKRSIRKAEGNAGLGGVVCTVQVPLSQWQTPNWKCPSPRRGWGQGRLQFIAHSEIKISLN